MLTDYLLSFSERSVFPQTPNVPAYDPHGCRRGWFPATADSSSTVNGGSSIASPSSSSSCSWVAIGSWFGNRWERAIFFGLLSFNRLEFGLYHFWELAGLFLTTCPSLLFPFSSKLRAWDFYFLLMGLHLFAYGSLTPSSASNSTWPMYASLCWEPIISFCLLLLQFMPFGSS